MSGSEPDSERADGTPGAEEEGPGVLGNLPRSRPAVRSPRREQARRRAERDGGGAAAPEPAAEPARGPEAELEALARAGLSLAGGAAALGLRVAGRAAAALRDAVDRR